MAADILVRHIISSFSPRAMRYAADHYRNIFPFNKNKRMFSNPKSFRNNNIYNNIKFNVQAFT